jgi:hypothetical protein
VLGLLGVGLLLLLGVRLLLLPLGTLGMGPTLRGVRYYHYWHCYSYYGY